MRKPTWFRRILRYCLWFVLILAGLFGLQLTVLAFPQVTLTNKVQAGTVMMYYDGDPDPAVEQLAAEVEQRLCGSRFYDSTRTERVFYYRDQDLYEFYVKLSLLPNVPQGYNLSILGNSYVSGPTVATLAERTGGMPKYSIWEGSPAHIIAHEIGHQYIADRIGRGVWRELPHWKQEGLPEYIANFGAIREDSSSTLRHRIGVFLSDRTWAATQGCDRQGWDRIHYEAWLLVEFLFDVQGMTLEDILADNVTKDDTYRAMIAWYQR